MSGANGQAPDHGPLPNGAIESTVYLSNDRITRAEETYVLMLAVLAAVCLFNRRRKAAS